MPSSPYIVAEISCNHLNALGRAFALVRAAHEAGADAVKFQCWASGKMVLGDHRIEGTAWAGQSMRALYDRAWTPWGWFPDLFEMAHDLGIECFASVFDHESLQFLEKLNCPRYKIASFEITDIPLIEAVAKTGKPMVISTGMASASEISRAWSHASRDVTLLKCTSAYPAPISSANLRALRQFGEPYGLSDHTLGHTVAVAATALGASMIEKHLTLRRSDGGPDAGFSAEPGELCDLVVACREAADAFGDYEFGPTEAEKPSLQFRRSLYWAADLPAGAIAVSGSIRTARPALGLAPYRLPELLERRLTRAVRYGEPVAEGDVE